VEAKVEPDVLCKGEIFPKWCVSPSLSRSAGNKKIQGENNKVGGYDSKEAFEKKRSKYLFSSVCAIVKKSCEAYKVAAQHKKQVNACPSEFTD
jgi:hypothetical protein